MAADDELSLHDWTCILGWSFKNHEVARKCSQRGPTCTRTERGRPRKSGCLSRELKKVASKVNMNNEKMLPPGSDVGEIANRPVSAGLLYVPVHPPNGTILKADKAPPNWR